MERIRTLIGEETDKDDVFYLCPFRRGDDIFRFRHADNTGMRNAGDVNEYFRIMESRHKRFRL